MAEKFKVTYYCEDGYLTGDRPINFDITTGELDGDESEEQLRRFFQESIQDHFEQRCSPTTDDEQAFIDWALEQQKK